MPSLETGLRCRAWGRSGLGLALCAAWSLVSISGCGNDDGPPLPPADAATSIVTVPADLDSSRDEAAVPTLAMITPAEGFPEVSIWEQIARLMGSKLGVLAEITRVNPGELASAARTAAHRGATALIVVAHEGGDAELAAAVAEIRESARKAGRKPLPILLGVKGLANASESVPVIRFSPLDEPVKKLVEASIEDARKAGFEPPFKTVLVVRKTQYREELDRIEAVHKAFEAAGADLQVLPDVEFTGFMAQGADAVRKVLAAEPDLAILIADEDQGARSAATLRDRLDRSKRRFVLGAIGPMRELQRLADFNVVTGLVVRDGDILARKAVETALEWSKTGQASNDDIIVDTPFIRPTGPEQEGFAPENMDPKPPAPPDDDTPPTSALQEHAGVRKLPPAGNPAPADSRKQE